MQIKAKSFSIPLFAALFVLIVSAFTLPQLLDPARIQGEMTRQLKERFGNRLETGRVELVWLPLPRLLVHNLRFADTRLNLTAPKITISPKWSALLVGQVRPGRISLFFPELAIKQLPFAEDEPPLDLPDCSLSISNGRLKLPAVNQWGIALSGPSHVQSVKGMVRLRGGAISFDLTGIPSFGERLSLAGSLFPKQKNLNLTIDCRQILLDRALASFADGRITPLAGKKTSFHARIATRDGRLISGSFKGDLPDLLASSADQQIPLLGKSAEFSLSAAGEELHLQVGSLSLAEPHLSLNGTARRSPAADKASAPVWDIDLKGTDFNLDQIRSSVLALWGENRYVKQSGEILLGGRAGKLAFRFRGPAEDLANIQSMTIELDEVETSIKIPAGGLVIPEVKGSALIKDGKLSIRDATARYGKTIGRKGSMVLGLADHDFTFILDVDLDADLAELPEALRRLVPHKPFQDELALFDRVSGRAHGHLHLGEHLERFTVEVEVASMQGKGRYRPLRRDFMVKGGSLSLGPSVISWRDIRGNFGPHLIKKSSGTIRFQDDVLLDLRALDAVLLAGELKHDNLSWLAMQTRGIGKKLSRVEGKIEVKDSRLSVRASAPNQWQGRATLLFKDLLAQSPLFPEAVKIQKGRIDLSETELRVSNLSASLLGDPVSLQATLSHRQMDELKGKIVLAGRISQRLGAWIRSKDLLSDRFFPRLPLQASGISIEFLGESTLLRGTLEPTGILAGTNRLDFSTKTQKSGLISGSIQVRGEGEAASLSLQFPADETDDFLFSWQGRLSKKTADRLLANNTILNGSISGEFQLRVPQDIEKSSFSGQISAKNFRLPDTDLEIRDLQLEGTSAEELRLKKLLVALNSKENIAINGKIRQLPTGIGLALNLQSASLEKKTLTDLLDSFEKQRKKKSGQRSRFENLTGTIDFRVNEFLTPRPFSSERTGAVTLLSLRPFNGRIQIMRDLKFAAVIDTAGLCGLKVNGSWFSSPDLGQGKIEITGTGPVPPRFEEVLSCLGYPQGLIVGGFSLDGKLTGEPDHWTGGSIQVFSNQGRILRLKLLAKIFSLINLTDLFLPIEQERGKHAAEQRGFPYSEIILKSHVKNNELLIDEGVVRGEGLNIFARGKINLASLDADLVLLIAPLKTVDALVSRIPLIGRLLGGETGTILTFPVGLSGNLKDPQVVPLPPSAVGEGLFNLVKRTLLLPFTVLSPILPDSPTDENSK